jgi:hypothetical protein
MENSIDVRYSRKFFRHCLFLTRRQNRIEAMTVIIEPQLRKDDSCYAL